MAALAKVGQDRGDDEDRLMLAPAGSRGGGQELGDPRGRALGGLVGGLAGVAVEAIGVLADVVRRERCWSTAASRRQSCFFRRNSISRLRDARAGDAAHDLFSMPVISECLQ